MRQPEKAGTVSLSSDTSTTQPGYDLGSSAMLAALYPLDVVRHSDLLVLIIIISNQCHEKKLEIKKDSFINCYSKDLVMKVK